MGTEGSHTPLKSRAISGVRWTSAAQATRMAVHLIATAIFARILVPADFGLMGMALVTVTFVTLFKDFGTGAAVIQRPSLDDTVTSSIFWANLLLSLLLGGALLLAAEPIAGFYDEPRLVPLLRVLALGLPLSGPAVVPLGLLQRDLRFDVVARLEMIAVVTGAIAGIAVAVAGNGVWGLVVQSLVGSGVMTVLALTRTAFRPRPVLSVHALSEVAGFSLNLSGFQFLNWVTRNLDQILIGRFLGATELGYYALACRLVIYPLQGITSVVGRVMFSVLSRIQDDPERFRNAYLRTAGALGMVAFPALAGLALVSHPMIEGLLGSEWLPAAPLVAILAVAGLFEITGGGVGQIYQATGRTDLLLRWGLIVAVVIGVAFGVGLGWRALGIACAYAAVAALLTYPRVAIPFRLVGLRVRALVSVLYRPALATMIMSILVLAARTALAGRVAPLVQLVLLVLVGIAGYLAASFIVNRERTRELAALLGRRGAEA